MVVHGRLRVEKWTGSSGVEMTSFEIDATFIGHDLSKGTSAFKRMPKPDAATTPAASSEEAAAA